MNFLKNIRISTIGGAFVVVLMLAGALLSLSSLNTVDNISSVKLIWDKFEETRSDKAAALSALHKEIGYGGMIHQFKNFVLRQDVERVSLINAELGGAASALARYRSLGLNDAEQVAIDDIQEMLAAYSAALTRTTGLIAEGRSPLEIDALVRVSDLRAINGLDLLDAEVTRLSDSSSSISSKSQNVASLRKALGYGGMIHEFKNMVLRGDPEVLARARSDVNAAQQVIATYSERNLSHAERGALADISGVIHAYADALTKTEEFAAQGEDPAVIDRVVRIDDSPALRGFDTLTREIALQYQREAAEVNETLSLVASVARTTSQVTIFFTLLVVVGTLWLFRTQITGPISAMTDNMMRLAGGELDMEVPAREQGNEIGSMARAVEVFRNTAIERELAMTELESFAYSVSHDLRGPLRAVDGFTQALAEDFGDEIPDEGKDYIERVRKGCGRMGEIIDSLLALSRISRATLEKEAVDLTKLARQVVQDFQDTDPDRAIDIEVEEGLAVQADKRLLRTVLENLLRNAWKFTRDSTAPRIKIGQEVAEGRQAIYVRDNGVGFDMAYADKLFKPFERLHTAQEFEGTGIGLATVARVVHRHGGIVWAEGKIDEGATIYFSL